MCIRPVVLKELGQNLKMEEMYTENSINVNKRKQSRKKEAEELIRSWKEKLNPSVMSLGLVSYGSSDDDGSDDDVENNDTIEAKNKVVKSQKDSTKHAVVVDDDDFGFDDEIVHTSSLKLPPPKEDNASAAYIENVEHPATGSQQQLKFSVIPQPKIEEKTGKGVDEEEPELIVQAPAAEIALREKPPPKRKPVRIAALAFPTVDSDSDDEGVPAVKQSKSSDPANKEERKTGLFSVLPPPRTSGQLFVPKAVASGKPTPKLPLPSPAFTKQPTSSTKPVINSMKPSTSGSANKSKTLPGIAPSSEADSSDEDDAKTSASNFFSIGEEDKDFPIVPSIDSSIETDSYKVSKSSLYTDNTNRIPAQNSITNRGSNGSGVEVVNEDRSMENSDWGGWGMSEEGTYQNTDTWSRHYAESYAGVEEVSQEYLQDEQFLRLQGRRNRGKEINMKEIRALDAPSVLELTKNMTVDEELHQSHSSKDLPTSQQKRKHQITFLAHQAKEREFQLKNQWAENRVAKRQAQSKYGF